MRILKLFAFLIPFLLPLPADALTLFVTTRIAVVAQSTLDNTAHWISPVTLIDPTCNGRIWIHYDDKEMFATALTAQANKLQMEIWFDNLSTTKSFPGYGGSSPCRVIAINMKYVP